MTLDEFTKMLELQTKASDERFTRIELVMERQGQRMDALTMNLELLSRDVESLRGNVAQDAENIRALARIAEAPEHRLGDLEEGRA